MFLLVLLLVAVCYGETIDEVIEVALKESPRIKAIEKELNVYKGLEISVSAFPNPEARLESGFVTNDKDGKPKGRIFNTLEFDQPLPLWGIREKGRRVVRKEREAFQNIVEARKREVIAEIYRMFYESLFRKEVVKVWEENLKTAKEVEEFVRKSYELGEVTPLELLRAQREKDLARIQLEIAKAKFSASLKELSALVGKEIKDVEGDLSAVARPKSIKPEEVPTVQALRKRVQALEEGIRLEKALAKPTVGVGFVVEDSEEGYYGLRGSLTVGLPIFYRRQGEILQKVVQKEVVRERISAERLLVENKIRAINLRLGVILGQLEKLEKEVLPRAKEELELAIKSYRLRVITLLELSDVRRRYYELLLNRAELLRDAHAIYSEFVAIGGWR